MPSNCDSLRAALAVAEGELITLEATRDVALAAKDVAAVAVDVAIAEYALEAAAYSTANANVASKLAQIEIIEQDLIAFGCNTGTGSGTGTGT